MGLNGMKAAKQPLSVERNERLKLIQVFLKGEDHHEKYFL